MVSNGFQLRMKMVVLIVAECNVNDIPNQISTNLRMF